ncbi:MAG TPA: glutamyl-tRNA reductase, partial [Anaerolineales bacterium]|nr:glutamyl-tRNA reductase [Anaerolineales bacterium]
LGQVTRALKVARGEHATGPILNRLFQAAIHAGKRARAETTISRNPASVSSLAASVAEKALGQIKSASVVILGAGEAGELMVEALRKRGVDNIKVINRTLARAQELARLWNAEAVPFEFLQQALCETDILISSTSALQFVITKQMVRQAMETRTHRPLVLIDLAVPRDIDPSVAGIPHVKLFDIDGLNEQLESSLASRMNEVPRVQQILDEEASLFRQFLNSLAVLPMIAEMHEQAETIRAAELQKTFRHMPNLTDAERKRIEALTQSLVKKILDQPTRHLRNESAPSDASRYPLLINN